MADEAVGWCGRLSPPAAEPGAPPAELPEPDPAIERLLALCAGAGPHLPLEDDADASQSSSASEEILSNQDLTLDKAVIARDLLGECDAPASPAAAASPCWEETRPSRTSCGAVSPPPCPVSPPPCPVSPPPPADEEAPYWRRTVKLGAAHQAVLPARRRLRPPARPTADRLLWDPCRLPEPEVERYQRRLRPAPADSPKYAPDNEQALYQLQACGHDVEEALRRVRPGPAPRPRDPRHRLAHWSDQECDDFEHGLRLYGKDFVAIRRHKVRTRSVGEIVNFYYLWKKTERHRQFLIRGHLEKRKYGPHSTEGEASSDSLPPPLSSVEHLLAPLPPAACSSLQVLMATDPWEHGHGGPGLAGLIASCPQLLLP